MKRILSGILLSLLGLALILWGAGTVALGLTGDTAVGVITSVRREGGERTDGKPGRYTYVVGYDFPLPDGTRVSGFSRKIGNSVYRKADGTSPITVRYWSAVPFLNCPEEAAHFSVGQVILIGAGIFLLVYVRKRK